MAAKKKAAKKRAAKKAARRPARKAAKRRSSASSVPGISRIDQESTRTHGFFVRVGYEKNWLDESTVDGFDMFRVDVGLIN